MDRVKFNISELSIRTSRLAGLSNSKERKLVLSAQSTDNKKMNLTLSESVFNNVDFFPFGLVFNFSCPPLKTRVSVLIKHADHFNDVFLKCTLAVGINFAACRFVVI